MAFLFVPVIVSGHRKQNFKQIYFHKKAETSCIVCLCVAADIFFWLTFCVAIYVVIEIYIQDIAFDQLYLTALLEYLGQF